MTYIEEFADIFLGDNKDVYYAQCISADFGMGAGIAVAFNRRMNCKSEILKLYPNTLINEFDRNVAPLCVLTNRCFNLITKRNYWNKPDYKSFSKTLSALKQQIIAMHIKKLTIPPLGCGLDKLSYDRVRELIFEYFNDTDIEIICRTNNLTFRNNNFKYERT